MVVGVGVVLVWWCCDGGGDAGGGDAGDGESVGGGGIVVLMEAAAVVAGGGGDAVVTCLVVMHRSDGARWSRRWENNQTIKPIPIPYHIYHYHTTPQINQTSGKYHSNTGKV
jgi:hypothetical protein